MTHSAPSLLWTRASSRSLAWAFVLVCACDQPSEEFGAETDGVIDTPIEGQCEIAEADDDPYADCIEAFVPGPDAAFGHDALPDIVLGAPMPNEAGGGSMHVASLGCGGSITLAFDGAGIEDRPGTDFLVFENPFAVGDQTFAEPARVLVSDDGTDWRAFACDLSGDESWPPEGCAGVTPTATDFDDETVTPQRSGGDGFDLADVGLSGAHYVRVVDVSTAYFGHEMWCAGAGAGFDLDAIAVVSP